MNSPAVEAQLDALSPDHPLDMDMSGFEPSEGYFFPVLEAGAPLDRTESEPLVDFSFLDGTVDEEAQDCLLQQVPVFLDRMVWSSLTVVLLLHATLACLLPLFIKQPVEVPPTVIEAQLVLLPAGPQKGEQGSQSASPAPPAPVPPPPAPTAKEEPAKPHQIAKVDGILPPEHEVKPRVKKRHNKIVREVRTVQPVSPARPRAVPPTSPAVGAPGNPNATGPAGSGGSGKMKAAGGSGLSELAFGSPDGPRFLHQVAPTYPPLARRLERQGTVLLRVTIGVNGRAVKVEVLKKAGFGMDEEALKAVRESTFVPAKRGGQSVTCRALLPIRFVLEQS